MKCHRLRRISSGSAHNFVRKKCNMFWHGTLTNSETQMKCLRNCGISIQYFFENIAYYWQSLSLELEDLDLIFEREKALLVWACGAF